MAMKKGFFFSLDAFFAVIIFTLILVSVYSFFINTQELRQQYFYSEDILNIFTNKRMENLQIVDTYPDLIELKQYGLIQNLTIIEEISYLQSKGYTNYSQRIFYNLTHDFLGDRYGVEFDIDGLVYKSDKNATALVARQRYFSGSEIV